MSNATISPSRALSWYCAAILSFWVIEPEIRRLVDWHAGFRASQVLAIVPLAALTAFALALIIRGGGALSRRMALLAWIWVGSFSYAAAIGWLSGQRLSSAYDFIQFVAPVLIALWLTASGEPSSDLLKRFSTVLLAIAGVVSAYGVIQFVALPPWDAAWMVQASRITHMVSNGQPFPFEVRVFSVLASPTPCAAFLAIAMALNLYRLRDRRPLPSIVLFLCAITLALTLVRSAWVALVVAVVVYLLFTPKAKAASAVTLAFCITIVGFFSLVSPWIPKQAGEDVISRRVQTFSDLARDSSVNARTLSTADLLNQSVSDPLGQGLGLIGTSTQLTSSTHSIVSIDGGFQARFAEMGFFGFAGYVATLLFAFGMTLRRWQHAKQSGDVAQSENMAAVLAAQTVLLVMDVSLDAHVNVLGALFWLTVGIALAYAPEEHSYASKVPNYARGGSSKLKLAT